MDALESPDEIKITLRKATPADIPAFIELEESVSHTNTYSAAVTEEEWIDSLKKEKVFAIEVSGHLVGDLTYEYKSPQHVYISGIVIVPEFQGKGIGGQVLGGLMEKFRDIQRVDLKTHPENEKALKLYQRHGFKIESQEENPFGDGERRVIMARVLD